MLRRSASLALLALALAGAAPAHAADRGPLFGVSVNRVINDDFKPSHWDAPFAAVRASGLRQARTDAFWMWAEPKPPRRGRHIYDWRQLDAIAAALARHELRWLPILDYSAVWAASYQGDYHSPPRSNADYAAYVRAFAARYGRGGAFWARHPKLPKLPVTDYEIWNEPNNGQWFWRPKPDAGRYADMYLRARKAIRAVDKNATVIVGGLVAHSYYVMKMFAARPDLRGNVDAFGWHAYGRSVNELENGVHDLRGVLQLEGEPNLPIHLTELGWPTAGNDPTVLREGARAGALEAALSRFARSDCGIHSIVVYTWQTPGHDATGFGIRRPDGGAAPSSRAFDRVLAGYRRRPATRVPICHPPGDAEAIASSLRLGFGSAVTALTFWSRRG